MVKFVFALIFVAALAVAALASFTSNPGIHTPGLTGADTGIAKFTSEQDFKSYLEEASLSGSSYYGGFGLGASRSALMENAAAPTAMGSDAKGGDGFASNEAPGRYSETNVQVLGIDEPDIVKTDGNRIYYSQQGGHVYYDVAVEPGMPYYYAKPSTSVINAFPVDGLAVASRINETGNMLLSGKTLVIISWNAVSAYDVTDPANPARLWTMEVNGSISDARLLNGKVYLITQTYLDQYHPCPVVPLTKDGVSVVVACSAIYHPVRPMETSVTYNVMMIEPASGNVEKAVSFAGSYGSAIYMSRDALYLTYNYQVDTFEVMVDFFTENPGMLPSGLTERINTLMGYDISSQSKMTEILLALSGYTQTLSAELQQKFSEELSSGMANYTTKHAREFSRTGIVKISATLDMAGTATVPGTLLNQFSLDEYNGNLRVATTIGGGWFMWGVGTESVNDVYVLDSSLNTIGSVIDLGRTERIYSVRFVEDKAYVVTFRQTDPFYVLDMSNPAAPVVKGELKIPGFSSYLHPMPGDKVLGIGQENWSTKLSMFDVSDPSNPQELDKYNFDKYSWSEAQSNHHAFLLDTAHEVFFLPANNEGYVFSYAGNAFAQMAHVENMTAQRAVYIDDYLYIIGTGKLVVLDENSWTVVKELELPQDAQPDYAVAE